MTLISTHANVYLAMMVNYARMVSINISVVLYFIEKRTYTFIYIQMYFIFVVYNKSYTSK